MEYGCIGEKLSHSFSKEIHARLFDYNYELKEIAPDDLRDFMYKGDFKAINVTIPYKREVLRYLEAIDETAVQIGAVNTVVNRNGMLFGYNTDFSGLKALIEVNGIEIKDKKVLILGSGGTSKTALAVAEFLGAKTVFRVSRGGNDGCITYEQAVKEHGDADVIINTTPCGMYPKIGECAIDIDKFKKLSAVVDAVYNPLRSELVIRGLKRGIKAVGGLYMLVSQAVFAAEHFMSVEIEKSVTDRIFKEMYALKENIVLIGMPGCGKSTVGKALSKELGFDFVDSDEEIVKRAGVTIPEIFSQSGEEGFRKLEAEVIKSLSALQHTVIATGGGVILNERNVDLLRQNGRLVFLDRSLEKLAMTDDRPLSSDFEKLKKRYEERYDKYKNSADIIIDADGSIEENVNAIKAEWAK